MTIIGGYAISGSISRANLPSPLSPLPILQDPFWPILGGNSEAADLNSQAGIDPGLSAHKYVWANSPYVRGQQMVLAVPDLSTLDMRLVVDGPSMVEAQTYTAELITAITDQATYTVTLTIDGAEWGWNCFTADYQVAFNQLMYWGYLFPVYVSMPRDPTPVYGPV